MTPHPEFFDRDGAAWLPIGCFLIRTPTSLIIVDAGMGPQAQHLPDGMMLVGGQLLIGLYAHGVMPADIDIVVCTHLHSDHVGWLFTPDSAPVFSTATLCIGQADLDAVRAGALGSADHIRHGLEIASGAGGVSAITGDVEIAPGIVAQPSPGHTLGHYLINISSGDERLLLVGDAITCPIQLHEPRWHSFGDVHPALGNTTRSQIWNRLRNEQVAAIGSHFPGLRPGMVAGEGTEWVEICVAR
jgi:glyoxylase-like metal-dependent hydrolase (beta-lactamase superfamily II)